MVDIIGNSFDGLGIIPSSKMIKGGYRTIIGNGSGLFRQVLGFDKGIFANTSTRYITAKNPTTGLYEMTGPFGANVLATRNISGDTYGQFETQDVNNITYSLPDSSHWVSVLILSITQNAGSAPDGTNTAVNIIPSTATGIHNLYCTPSVVSGNYYCIPMIVKKNGYHWIREYTTNSRFATDFTASFDLENGVLGTVINCTADILPLDADWFLCIVYTPQATSSGNTLVQQSIGIADGISSFAGDGTSGMLFWHSQIKTKSFNSSLIPTSGSAAVRSPDYFYFPSSAIPTWMKSKFTQKIIPNYDIPYTTEDKSLWSFNKTASTLATGTGYNGLAVDATNLYIANGGSKILSLPIGGGTPADLITGLSTTRGVAIDATTIYWTDSGAGKIQKAPIGGGSVTDLATGQTFPLGIAVDTTNVYWVDYTENKIKKVPIGGGSVTDVVIGLSAPIGIGLDGDDIYFTDSSGNYLKVVPKAGGTPVIVTSLTVGYSPVIVGDIIYVGCQAGGYAYAINKVSGVKCLLMTETSIRGLAVLNGALFVADQAASGTVKRRDSVTAWLTTTGTIKVVEGPDTKVETSAATASMHQNVEVEFDRVNGKITLSGFTTGDGEYTDTAWSDPDGFDVEYGCALGGAAQSDALVTTPKG